MPELVIGEINRQIAHTTRGFFSSKSDDDPKTMAPKSSAEKVGRRHTNIAGSTTEATPSSRATKRAITTYGSGKPRSSKHIQEYADFEALNNIDRASQVSLAASDHFSQPKGLPEGTMKDGFLDHNPKLLFPDSGSTVPFNDSSVQRRHEEARDQPLKPVSPTGKSHEAGTQHSSFPWTDTPKSDPSKQENTARHEGPVDDDPSLGQFDPPIEKPVHGMSNIESATANGPPGNDEQNGVVGVPPPVSSPMVIIPALETASVQCLEVEKPTRGRKRKSLQQEESSEPLNSDDQLVGLPKERYVPRPSKRRCTTVVDEPVDYSIAPERAAKKRRKTADGPVAHSSSTLDSQTPGRSVESKTLPSTNNAAEGTKPSSKQAAFKQDEAPPGTAFKPIESSEALPESPKRPEVEPLSPPTESAKPLPSLVKSVPRPDLQKTSPAKMAPPALPASATRKTPRRSHTTIFEDHTAQRSPSLREQQAARQASTPELPEPSQRATRGRRIIVQDDADEEDELAGEAVLEKPAPKKHGRPPKPDAQKASPKSRELLASDDSEDDVVPAKTGRRTKPVVSIPDDSADESAAKPSHTKSKRGGKNKSRAIIQDSEDEDEVELEVDDDDDGDDDDVAVDAPPKKKDSNRLAKDKTEAKPKTAEKSCRKPSSAEPTPAQSVHRHVLEQKDPNASTKRTGPNEKQQTPSPASEQAVEKQVMNPAPGAKVGPNSHSPIKKNNKAIYRVGLGRKHRVQPLLKSIRPVNGRKEDVGRVTTLTSIADLEKKWNAKEED